MPCVTFDGINNVLSCIVVQREQRAPPQALEFKRLVATGVGSRKTSAHMALEQQGLDEKQLSFERERLQRELINEMPSDLWNDG